MLYELIGVVRPGNIAEVKEIIRTTGSLLLSANKTALPSPYTSTTSPSSTSPSTPSTSTPSTTTSPTPSSTIHALSNWGPFTLPRPVLSHQSTYRKGHYFVLRFSSSIPTQHLLRRTLGLDPRMIRFSIVKVGDTKGKGGVVGGMMRGSVSGAVRGDGGGKRGGIGDIRWNARDEERGEAERGLLGLGRLEGLTS
ncbi:MAG: hypothetical protein M1817_005740 [Caeruleum heppii]|nr:MAG: hypothetical protein M1817_005740 [Caeruleum heppii]